MMRSREMSDMLSIQVAKDVVTGQIFLKSIEIAQPNFHHRMIFKENSVLEEVITPEFSEYIVGRLRQLGQDRQLISVPDTIFALPGIAMGRLRLVARSSGTNPRRITFRFKYLIGSLQRVIFPNLNYQFPKISAQDTLRLSNLKDLVLPISQGLADTQVGFSEGEVAFEGAKKQSLEHVEQDLLFYIELLKRYVQGMSEVEDLEKAQLKQLSKQ
ncbi:MAG: hypothetical protein AAF429_07915 [Pseudomonadota bacterium]